MVLAHSARAEQPDSQLHCSTGGERVDRDLSFDPARLRISAASNDLWNGGQSLSLSVSNK